MHDYIIDASANRECNFAIETSDSSFCYKCMLTAQQVTKKNWFHSEKRINNSTLLGILNTTLESLCQLWTNSKKKESKQPLSSRSGSLSWLFFMSLRTLSFSQTSQTFTWINRNSSAGFLPWDSNFLSIIVWIRWIGKCTFKKLWL